MDLEAIRVQWISEYSLYDKFVGHLKEQLRRSLREEGILGEVSGRPKDIDSLLKKIPRKGYSTYEQVTDKAGVRVVVRFLRELDNVDAIIYKTFQVVNREDKTALLGAEKVGYQGVHYDIKLLGDGGPFPDLSAEVQVRTLAQDVWSRVSHELSYKSEIGAPIATQRRMFCLSALFEIADQEFSRLHEEIGKLPNAIAFRVLSSLERQYYKLTSRQYDKELALETVSALAPLYSPGVLDAPNAYFDQFFMTNQSKLTKIFADYGAGIDHSPFLFQPEVFMVFDQLDRDYFGLIEKWGSRLPPEELQNLAVAWGKSLY